jgi:uncharacterized protein YprB with RNaseH-like and TPR domain
MSFYEDLKNKLLNEYQNQSLDDIPGSEIIENCYGETLKIVQKEKLEFKLKKRDFKNELFNDLTLVPGIGSFREKQLNDKGFNTIDSLSKHDKYSNCIQEVIDTIESESLFEKINLIKKNNSSFKNIMKSISLFEKENFKFMDIETLGLSNVPIILIGLAEIKGKNIISSQYLLREKKEEPAILYELLNHLDENSAYVTYNGASFDIPFIKNRFTHYQMDYKADIINYDLLHFTRKLWKERLPNCKLDTVEKHLFNIERIDDVPGSHIPNYYDTYLQEKNIGPLIPIIEHNRMDIVSLAKILMKIHDEV